MAEKASKAMLDYLKRGTREEKPERMPEANVDPLVFSLALKKKRQTAMLKQMLNRGGYEDLAKMANIRRDHAEGVDK